MEADRRSSHDLTDKSVFRTFKASKLILERLASILDQLLMQMIDLNVVQKLFYSGGSILTHMTGILTARFTGQRAAADLIPEPNGSS